MQIYRDIPASRNYSDSYDHSTTSRFRPLSQAAGRRRHLRLPNKPEPLTFLDTNLAAARTSAKTGSTIELNHSLDRQTIGKMKTYIAFGFIALVPAQSNSRATAKLRLVAQESGKISPLPVGLTAACLFLICNLILVGFASACAQQVKPLASAQAPYRRADLTVENRINDLMQRMTLEEKVRQLDMYAGVPALMSQHSDSTHATADAVFLPDKGQQIWGTLGVGSIHDLNPTPEQSNAIQKWVIAHNHLGIPTLFIEEGLHGFDTGTVFPAPIGLAATWNPEIAQQTGAAIAAEARATGVAMILAPVLDLAGGAAWKRI
jgi:hypothetical protein